MTLQQTFLTNIESELRARYNLAHVSATSALDIARAELDGAVAQFATAKAMGDTFGMHYQKQRGAALIALIKSLEGK